MTVIVVGVDGSEDSKEALRWALEEARLRRASLRAVYAWAMPAVYVHGYAPPDLFDRDLMRDRAAQALDAVVAEVAGEDPPVPVEGVTSEGSVARVLVEAASEADLLVVGSAGTATSQGFCSVRSATSAPTTRHARW